MILRYLGFLSALLVRPSAIEWAGLVAIVVGVGMVYLPAAFIVLGLGALLWSRGAQLKEPER